MNFQEALRPMEHLVQQAIEVAPKLAMIVLILLLGLLASSVAGRLTRWLVKRSGLETVTERFGIAKVLYAVGIHRGFARLMGTIVWASGLLLTVSGVLELAGLPGIAQVSASIVGVLPRLILAATIAGVGFVVADVLRSVVKRASKRGGDIESPEFAGQLAYYAVLILSVTMALEQAGVETGLINAIVKIAVLAGTMSFGLAFALGSRNVFRNYTARFYLERLIRPGDTVGMGTTRGVVVRYGPISMVIKAEQGERVIPCAQAIDQEIHLERGQDAPPRV